MSTSNSNTQQMNMSLFGGVGEQKDQQAHEAGKKAGCYTRTVIGAIFVLFLLYIALVVALRAGWISGNDSGVGSAVNHIVHQACKNGSGCGHKCPYISMDDPRVTMVNQANGITEISTMLKDGYKGLKDEIETEVDTATGAIKALCETRRDTDLGVLNECVEKVKLYSTAASALADKYKDSVQINVEVVKAKNRIAGLEAAVAITVNKFALTSMALRAYIMDLKIKGLNEFDKKRISEYNDGVATSINDSNFINNAKIELPAGMEFILEDNHSPDEIVAQIASLMSSAESSKDVIMSVSKRFSKLQEVYQSIIRQVEAFSNSLPAKLSSDDMTNLINDGDYDTALVRTALEPEIVSNHLRFAKERSTFDSGGGVPSVRDDDNDVVPWVGLFGRPTYRRSDGSSADISSEPLKSIPSDNPTDLMRKQTPRLSFN